MTLYWGEEKCGATLRSGAPCQNKAYYEPRLCGVHCRGERVSLSKNPRSKKDLYEEHQQGVEEEARQNRAASRKGKMRMLHSVPLTKGEWNIFPNFKHGSRRDGKGLPALSPMSLGPIEEPGMEAQSLENYHQFSKVFPSEVDEAGNPTAEFYALRAEMFEAPPQRHKMKGKPLYSVYFDAEGREKRCTHQEARQIYCREYTRLAGLTIELTILRDMVAGGYNICIWGYDGFALSADEADLVAAVAKHYRDLSKPFGHEAVLFTLLTLSPEDYPW